MTGIFKDIFDINASAFKAKPCKNAFQEFINLYAIKPSQSIMFDDKLPNIETAISYGLKGVHIHPEYNTKKLNQESTYAGFCDLKTLFKNFEHWRFSYAIRTKN